MNRIPLVWTARGKTMVIEDAANVNFIKGVITFMFSSGLIAGVDKTVLDKWTPRIDHGRSVKLTVALHAKSMTLTLHAFDGLPKVSGEIEYAQPIAFYHTCVTSPNPSTAELAAVCGPMLLLIEQKAPGLYLELLENGLPREFRFEKWRPNLARFFPPQILRVLPSYDPAAIVAWSKTPAYVEALRKQIEAVDERQRPLEDRN